MNKMSYLCRAERQVRVKAYASSLDLNLSAPSKGTQVCRTSKPGFCVSSICRCKLTVNKYSTAFSLVSIKSVRLCNMCLVI